MRRMESLASEVFEKLFDFRDEPTDNNDFFSPKLLHSFKITTWICCINMLVTDGSPSTVGRVQGLAARMAVADLFK